MKADLAAAGVDRETSDGVFEFHSLRTRFISTIAATGEVGVGDLMALARHADIRTTQRYLRADQDRIAAAVEAAQSIG